MVPRGTGHVQMVRLLLLAAVGVGIGIFLQLYDFIGKTKPPSSVAGAETRFSYINDLQKKKGEDIWPPEQKRQVGERESGLTLAAIAARAQPEAKSPNQRPMIRLSRSRHRRLI